MNTHTDNDELRSDIHMKMLSKSKNAKDCGDLTVVPLGFAVTVALEILQLHQPTKSSGELEEVLNIIGYTPNLDSRAFAKEAIESYVATQTTKLQAEARINECAKTNAWACTIPAKHALGESGQEAVYDYVDQRIAALEREHKIGEDGE